jgi:hypothetical protein
MNRAPRFRANATRHVRPLLQTLKDRILLRKVWCKISLLHHHPVHRRIGRLICQTPARGKLFLRPIDLPQIIVAPVSRAHYRVNPAHEHQENHRRHAQPDRKPPSPRDHSEQNRPTANPERCRREVPRPQISRIKPLPDTIRKRLFKSQCARRHPSTEKTEDHRRNENSFLQVSSIHPDLPQNHTTITSKFLLASCGITSSRVRSGGEAEEAKRAESLQVFSAMRRRSIHVRRR